MRVNPTTKAMIELAIANDSSIQPHEKKIMESVLNGECMASKPDEDGGPLLLNMTKAAKYLGVSRVTFWRMVKKGDFKPVEISDGVFRYRRGDLDNFAVSKVDYEPVSRGLSPSV